MAGCGKCFWKRSKFVGPRGNPEAPIYFVGEAPGTQELIQKKSFVGPSGQLLLSTFPDDVSEDDYYMTNAMECLPIKVKDSRKNMDALWRACKVCKERLEEQITQHKPEIIVALGNSALWTLLDDPSYKITQERGKLFPCKYAKRGVVASVHPAFLLRGGGSYRKFYADINYAFDLSRGASVKRSRPLLNIEVAETASDVYRFIDQTFDHMYMFGQDVVGADIETDGFDHIDNVPISFGWTISPETVYIVPEHLIKYADLNYRDFITSRFNGGPFQWCWHNGKFDIKFMRRRGYTTCGVDHDTMLMSYTMEERRGFHDLEQVASDELGAPNYKGMLNQYLPNKKTSYRAIPKPVLYKYQALDIGLTLQLYYKMYPRIVRDERNNTLYHRVLIPASDFLAHVEDVGMLVDMEAQRKNTIYYEDLIEQYTTKINDYAVKAGFQPINCNSPQQVGRLIYDDLKLAKHNKGTAVDVLESLPQHPVVVTLQDYRKVAKAYGTYVKNLPGHMSSTGRVHSSFLLHASVTGRLASRGPNLQNQPRGARIRGQFKAADGHILMELDLSQAELRCLAALSKDEELSRIYLTHGLSLHKEVSVALWGPQWKEQYGRDDPNDPVYALAYEQYIRTKALNFGIVYGRQAFSIAQEFNISVAEANYMIETWAKRFPQAWGFISQCRNAPVKGINLVTPFGRRKRINVVSQENLLDLQNEAANFPHQSIASDITLMTGIRIRPVLLQWGARIVNIIHDAILVEMPHDHELMCKVASYATREMSKTPIEWGITHVPFESDAKIGTDWGHLKDFNFDS